METVTEILDEVGSPEELKRFESLYNFQLESEDVNIETTFNYAWSLIRSRYAADIRKGICLLETIFNEDKDNTKRDCVYYLAIGYAKLKEYKTALHYTKAFLRLEPGNTQVQNLDATIRKRMEKDGLKGIAFAGGAVLVIGGLVSLGLALTRK